MLKKLKPEPGTLNLMGISLSVTTKSQLWPRKRERRSSVPTSAALVAVVRKPPHVAQPHGATQARQDELDLAAPVMGSGPAPEV